MTEISHSASNKPTNLADRPLRYWQGSAGTIVLATSVLLERFPDERFSVATIDDLSECDQSAVFDAIRRLQDDESALRHALTLEVEHEDGPCWWDHNGNCQEHGSFGYDHTCDTADARLLLGFEAPNAR